MAVTAVVPGSPGQGEGSDGSEAWNGRGVAGRVDHALGAEWEEGGSVRREGDA